MRLRAIALTAAFAVVACTTSTTSQGDPKVGPEPGPDPTLVEIGPEWLRGVHPEDLPEDAYVIGAAAHEDPAEARARAIIALEAAVWGPVAERPDYHSLPESFSEGDVIREEALEDGRTAVLVAVTREAVGVRIEDWLDDAAAALAATTGADEPGARIAVAVTRQKKLMLEKYGCQRRQQVAREECAPTAAGDSPFQIVAPLVQLRPALEDGIPRFPEQPPLRPAGVRLLWQKEDGELVPFSGVPLLFSAPEGVLAESSATTDERGYAEVAFADEPGDTPIEVTLDAASMFGELAAEWPGTRASLVLREVTSDNLRIAVHLFEHINQEPTDERTTARAMVAKLDKLGYHALVLPADLAPTLDAAREGRFATAVADLSEAAAGKADIIVMGEVHSDFLSRAVGRSVWHEGIANVKVYHLWTGRHIGDTQRETRAKGMGDFNAARKAMKALGNDLALAVRDLLTEGKLTVGVAPQQVLAIR